MDVAPAAAELSVSNGVVSSYIQQSVVEVAGKWA